MSLFMSGFESRSGENIRSNMQDCDVLLLNIIMNGAFYPPCARMDAGSTPAITSFRLRDVNR